jgi:hypothetical protein
MPAGDLPIAEFAFPGPLRDQLVAAILAGEKTTTTGLVAEYEREGEPLPNRPVARKISRLSLASIVTDSLRGSTPMITRSIALPPRSRRILSEDGQRYFELSRPFLSHASPRCPARTHAMKEPRPGNRACSREESIRPGTSPEPAPAQAV